MPRAPLPTRPLGTTGLDLTTVGFGAWAAGGGGWAFGWGPQEDDESHRRHAPRARARRQLDRHRRGLRAGPLRGGGGPGARELPEADRPYVFTKCGLVWDEQDRMAAPGRTWRRIRSAGSARPRSAGSASSGSISTSSTGPTRSARPSRRRGRRWRGWWRRARCARPASPTSTSRCWSAARRSATSTRCSRRSP